MPMVYEKFVDDLGDRMHAFTQYQPLAQTYYIDVVAVVFSRVVVIA